MEKVLNRTVGAVTTKVSQKVKAERLKACNACDQTEVVNPLPMIEAKRCKVCTCLIDAHAGSDQHPAALEGRLSLKMVKTTCKHPKGSRWAIAIALFLLSFTGFSQGALMDTLDFERVEDIADVAFQFYSVDTVCVGSECYIINRRASKEVVREYMQQGSTAAEYWDDCGIATGLTFTLPAPVTDYTKSVFIINGLTYPASELATSDIQITGTTLQTGSGVEFVLEAGDKVCYTYKK